MLTLLLLELLMSSPLTVEGPGVPPGIQTFDELRWKQRVLLLFPGESRAPWQAQLQGLEQARPGLAERDVLVLVVGGAAGEEARLPEAREARERWKVAPGEGAAVLIGKDGGEKWRSPLPAPLKDLFPVIDAMPMRQQERGGKGKTLPPRP
jgi:hypothetical protein